MSTHVIIVAAGAGTRAGGDLPKQYQDIGGRPVLAWTIAAFAGHRLIDEIVVVINPAYEPLCHEMLGDFTVRLVAGGKTRQQSVFAGLQAVHAQPGDKVLIHDGARPFVCADLITSVIENIMPGGCTLPGLAIVDTTVEVSGDLVSRRLDRDRLRAVQTPQGFVFADILSAHQAAADNDDNTATDDSALVPTTRLVPGDPANFKITTADDLKRANEKMKRENFAALPDIRTGQGFDVHAFEDGDQLILCGVSIPFDKKLKGHSDADVAMHALTDAILGAIGEGDIGKHYPPSDPQWKGAASEIFLKGAAELVSARGGMIAHCDITIICEQPKLRPHIDQMRQTMANFLGIGLDRMSIKATTSEKLGFTGRQEGIAALATATVRLP